MARWRLTEPHYLKSPGTEWEYTETDRLNGKQIRKRFEVPLYCDSDSIVAYAGSEQRDDIVFEGEPTPAMEALDDEAKAISAKVSAKWVHPIESLPGQGYNDSLLNELQKQVAAIAAHQPVNPLPASGVGRDEFEQLKTQLAEVLARNAELESKAGKRKVA